MVNLKEEWEKHKSSDKEPAQETINTDFRIKQFEEFYDCLMQNAPEGYTPWFFPCETKGKNPDPSAIMKINPNSKGSWHDESARLNKEQCIERIRLGGNIGISARKGDALIIGDIDEIEYLSQMPKDTLTTTSRKRQGGHFFGWDKDGSAKKNVPTNYGELRSCNQYVLACGSYTPFDQSFKKDREAFEKLNKDTQEDKLLGYYTIDNKCSPKEIGFEDLPQFFKDKENENIETETKILQKEETNTYSDKDGKYSELFKLKVSDIVGLIPSNKRTGHPLHESDTNANWSLSKDGSIGHCWRDLVSLNAVQYLCVKAGYMDCVDAGTPHKGRGISKLRGDKKAFEVAYNEALKLGLIKKWEGKKENPYQIFTVKGQVQELYENQPFFYNKAGMFVVWDDENKKYEVSDEVDMLNQISGIGADTITSKTKTEIVTALKQYGRKKVPEEAPKTWVQFKDTIYDYKTGEEFKASPKYFITNPIPYKPGDSEDTPTIDKLFKEWVGEDYKTTLEEITAYTTSSDQFMQRLFAMVGGGSNGKGTYLKLLIKFLGAENTTSSEIKELSSNQFETSVIYKKLLCVVGEVSHDDLKNTNQLKKLGGEDPIRYCFKGKTPFTEESPTSLIANTNSMPKTPDKTMGFYRKWLIIDFPNQFTEIKHGLIENIPEVEFENLARKSLRILKELYKSQKFTNEGSFQERLERYEERSNPVGKFIELNCDEELGQKVELKIFSNKFNDWAKKNHTRVLSVRQVGAILREDGFDIGKRSVKIDNETKVSSVFIMNLALKTTETTETTESPSQITHGKLTEGIGSSGSSGSFSEKASEEPPKQIPQNITKTSENPTFCKECNSPMVDNKCIGECE